MGRTLQYADKAAVGGGYVENVVTIGVAATADGDNTVIAAPGVGRRLCILSFTLVPNGAGVTTFKSGATTLWTESTGSGAVKQYVNPAAIVCGTNQAFIISNAVGQDHYGVLAYLVQYVGV